jgi:hypothetical protein
MNKFITAVFIISGAVSFAQSANWDWAKSSGGIHNDQGESIACDTHGNIYATGTFQSPSIGFGTNTHNNADTSGLQPLNKDLFIVKYDSSGNVMWSQSIGGIDNDVATSIVTDAADNMYVSGYFVSPAIQFGTHVLANSGYTSFFIVKYDPSGNVVWAKSATGSGIANGLSIDNSGNVYVTGNFNSAQITFDTTALANNGGWDIFVTKYDTNGNVLWAKSSGSVNDEKGQSIAVNAAGDAFITGQFCSPSVSIGSAVLTNPGGTVGYGDFFIAKYDASGNPVWAKSAGGEGNFWDSGYGISTDDNGNAYVIAEFCSPTVTVGGFVLTNLGASNNNIFIAKYDSNGVAVWAKSLGLSQNHGFGIDTDASGNVYAISNFAGQINLDGTTLNFSSGYDIFIVKYDTQGSVVWASSVGEPLWDYGNSICVNPSDEVYVTGSFYENSIGFGTTTLDNFGGSDICIAKLTQENLGTIGNFEKKNIVVFPNPAKDIINIQGITQKSTLSLYDQRGKLITTKETDSSTSIDTKKLQAGAYFLVTATGKNKVIHKILVE